MKYTKLGKSDLDVSRICMGCMGFGDASNGQHSWTIDETSTRDIIKYGLENGINFYDTAIAYQNGTSEKYVGKAMIERVESRHGLRQLSYMKELGMGNDLYTIIDIDNEDTEITAEEITVDILPEWNPDIYNTIPWTK